jgi:rubrerythrin
MKGDNPMADEQTRMVEALRFAIQMEIDGKRYYEQTGQATANGLGKELYQWLAEQEDRHKTMFEKIYESIEKKEGWPAISLSPVKKSGLSTIFTEAVKTADKKPRGSPAEVKAIEQAMEMEHKTQDYYEKRGKEATHNAEKAFYRAVAAEEQGHYLTLVDYKEYLANPAGFFVKAERHSLDGG